MFFIFIFSLLFVLLVMYLFPKVQIEGNSMSPTFSDGAKVLSSRLFKNYKVGSVYVFYRPDSETPYLVIKRLTKIRYMNGETYLFFEGDNKESSVDSRIYGYIHSSYVVAKLINSRERRFNGR